MGVHSLKTIQTFPATLEETWNFFSLPANLAAVTPAHLEFKIQSNHHGDRMYAGQIIEYTIKPLFGVPVYWMTEITHVEDRRYFVDEQRYGPYSMWHHQHHFREIEGGVEMTDIVHYKVPFSVAGKLANSLFVRRELYRIFSYRFEKAVELFGSFPDSRRKNIVFY
jgi:ligand-binding SRPBCC domain-containing protein